MAAQIFPESLFLVGCGNMTGQMLARWLECGLNPADVAVYRPSGRAVPGGVSVTDRWPEKLRDGTVVLLGMKPYQLGEVASKMAAIAGKDLRLVSILAGVKTSSLRSHFSAFADVVRLMPNTPVGVGQGVCALYADSRTGPAVRNQIEALMQPLGLAEWIADEAQFNLVTALTGCGPAYLFRFIDALATAAARLGLSSDQAERLALATVRGGATLAVQAHETPAILADRVASPGGMTREGMNVLDRDERLLALLTETLRAARDRGEEMAREADAR
ncbi:pyrroline-5-carboxylate reductase family protein [Rhizorhapis suberifaciens]|uniref:Pyrroline-5-carboxylate reductase n=1 Tax=Rhizorhapis suberifaciens TaxID=13656 RepID=A0A840HW93_9SPHN|nr:pyrroline-5-carboxylate reductase [Rhizorhapis suberifaciens]MBB4641684.1 pyrroline-5-carboxylate reductase [Rhizorhapis suberifaciens]